jgi:hypothetical protein
MTETVPAVSGKGPGRFDQVFESSDPEDRSPVPILLAIWFVWTVAMIVLITAHEPWRDELQAWAIARSSGNPIELIANLRYEGHPPLWYLILWPVAKVVPGLAGLKVATVVLGSAATWVVLRFMPVSIWIRVAILFGYFPLYEYGAISRSYTATWLCLVLALWLAHRSRVAPWMIAIALGALAFTTALAVPLAFAIALALWGGQRWASPDRRPADRRWIWAFGSLLAAVVLYGIVVKRTSFGSISSAFSAPLVAAAPISPLTTHRFWGNLPVRSLGGLGAILGIALAVALAWLLRRTISARTIWVVSTLGFFVVLAESGRSAAPRFAGLVWMGAIAAVWFAAAERQRIPRAQRQPIHTTVKAACVLVLAGSLWAAGWAAWIDSTTTFNGGKTAADWIVERANGPFVILCGGSAAVCSSVSIGLDVPVYMTADADPFTFVDYGPGWKKHLEAIDLPDAAANLEARTGAQVFVVDVPYLVLATCVQSLMPDQSAVFEPVNVCMLGQPVS